MFVANFDSPLVANSACALGSVLWNWKHCALTGWVMFLFRWHCRLILFYLLMFKNLVGKCPHGGTRIYRSDSSKRRPSLFQASSTPMWVRLLHRVKLKQGHRINIWFCSCKDFVEVVHSVWGHRHWCARISVTVWLYRIIMLVIKHQIRSCWN